MLYALCAGLSCAPWRVPALSAPAASEFLLTSAAAGIRRVEAAFDARTTGLAPFEINRVAYAIVEESGRYGIDPALVLAVIHTESGYYNFARSSVGALGLMQLMPATAEMLSRELGLPWDGEEALFDPETNVKLGTRYLAYLHGKYGDWDHALAAYNWGPGAIDRRLAAGRSLPSRYRHKVLAHLEPARRAR
jgi:soluble lytic murein transglycosylase-like protein